MTQSIRIAFVGSRGHQIYALRDLVARRATPDKPQAELVALAGGGDSLDGYDAWLSEQGVAVPRFDGHRELLDEIKPDLVVGCGPFERHAQLCVDAIERGVHVVTEKPLALTDDDLRRVRAAHAANPRVHLAGMMFSRYDPGFLEAGQMIARGEIGDVRLINCRKSYKLGERRPYHFDRATYGGTIPWVGVHAFGWAIAFVGAAPKRVYATHSTAANRGFGTMETTASSVLEFPDGVSASISVDVLRPDEADTHGDDWCRIVGTRGVLQVRPTTIDVVDATGARTLHPTPTGRSLVGDLLDAIALGSTPLFDAAETFMLTGAVLAARRSADERRVVEIESD